MSLPTRPRIDPTDDWQQLELLVRDPAQRTYELIRPVVLFGCTPAERARRRRPPSKPSRSPEAEEAWRWRPGA